MALSLIKKHALSHLNYLFVSIYLNQNHRDMNSGTYELTVSPDNLNLIPITDEVKISVKCK